MSEGPPDRLDECGNQHASACWAFHFHWVCVCIWACICLSLSSMLHCWYSHRQTQSDWILPEPWWAKEPQRSLPANTSSWDWQGKAFPVTLLSCFHPRQWFPICEEWHIRTWALPLAIFIALHQTGHSQGFPQATSREQGMERRLCKFIHTGRPPLVFQL